MKPHLLGLATLVACSAPVAEPGVDPSTSGDDSATAEPCGAGADIGLDVGQCAPDFTLPDSTGADFTLSDQRGKVALVDIAAIW